MIPDARHEHELRQAIADLTPTLEPWLSNQLVSFHVPYDMTCNVFGLVTEDDNNFGRLRLISLTPGSPAERHLAYKNVLGFHILTINGVRIRTVTDIRMILHDYHDPDWKRGPAYLTGVTILFGVAAINSPEPDQIEFSEQDHASARVFWSILGSSALEQPTIEPQCAVAIDPSSHHGHDNHATTAISACAMAPTDTICVFCIHV